MPRQETASRNLGISDVADVFLNIPYDDQFSDLYLAYIGGITAFGLTPTATLELPGGERRLDRIFKLIQSCQYSFHDLSRVELDKHRPPTPRFNMPFELGMAVAWEKLNPGKHVWFVLEAQNRRITKSLSDLGGTDVYIHHGRPSDVFREVGNALVRMKHQPSVADMVRIYRALKATAPTLKKESGARSVFEARMFTRLCAAARMFAIEVLGENPWTSQAT